LDTLKREHNKVVEGATDDLTNGLQALIPANPDADEQAAEDFGGTIAKLMDKFNQLMGEIEDASDEEVPGSTPPTTEGNPPSSKTPTLTLQKMSQEFLKGYDTLLSTKYLTRIRDNVKTAARRYKSDSSGALNLNFDSHYNKIVQKDMRVLGN